MSKDPTNSIKVSTEGKTLQLKENPEKAKEQNTHIHTKYTIKRNTYKRQQVHSLH